MLAPSFVLLLVACTQTLPPSASSLSSLPSSPSTPLTTTATTTSSTTVSTTPTSTEGCGEPGNACDPFVIVSFPYSDRRSTTDSPWVEVDSYACDPSIDESGRSRTAKR